MTEDITFDNAPSPQNPPRHRDTVIECRVSAEPKPDVSWRFNNRKIEPSTLLFVLVDVIVIILFAGVYITRQYFR